MVKCGNDKKRSSMNATESDKTFCDVGNVHVCNIGIIMGKNYLDNRHSTTITKDLTLKQMFDISTRLVSEQDEVSQVETIG